MESELAVRVNREAYPFAPHDAEVEGGRMHYIDEGPRDGPPVVLVHGTPTWSFMYRRLIRRLADEGYRCVAPDNVGFGLSARPFPYTLGVRDHAHNVEALIERLGLRDVALVVHDFGGPIGLAYALRRPENVRALVLMNTWLWSLEGSRASRGLRFAASPLGRALYRRLNLSARVLLPSLWGRKALLTPELRRQYAGMFPTPRSREGTVALARDALAASAWYDELWERRERLAETPALLLWGLKDPAFGGALGRWREALPRSEVVEFADAGHFVPDECAPEVGERVAAFLGGLPSGGRALDRHTLSP